MSAPVFVIDADAAASARAGDIVVVDGPEARHAATVTRLSPGETVELVDGHGRRVRGSVESASKDTLTVRVAQVGDEPKASPRVVVVQALLKGEHGDLALDQLTQVGVDEIVPWASEHAVVHLSGERAAKAVAKWQTRVVAAGKQSRRARWPELASVATTADVCARIEAAGAGAAVVLHESTETALADVPLPGQGTIILVVGPDGGISARDL